MAIWIEKTQQATRIDLNTEVATTKSFQVCMAKKSYSNECWRTWEVIEGCLSESFLCDIATEVIVFAEFQQRTSEACLNHESKYLGGDRQSERNTNLCHAHLIEQPDQSTIRAELLTQAKQYRQALELKELLRAVQREFSSDDKEKINLWCQLISTEIRRLDPLSDMRFLQALNSNVKNEKALDLTA